MTPTPEASGSYIASAVAAGRTVWALGMNNDQKEVAPDVILGSAVIRIPVAFKETAERWLEGEVGSEAIYAGAHNSYLEAQTRALRNRLSPYRRFQLSQPGRIERSLAEHDAVVRAILAGDPDGAAEAMRGHVAIQGEVFTDLVAALPPAYVQAAAV